MIGLLYGEKKCDNMLSRFHLISERYGQTDGWIDGQNDYIISRVSVLTRDKNCCKRTILVQLIAKNVVACFLGHSVVDNRMRLD